MRPPTSPRAQLRILAALAALALASACSGAIEDDRTAAPPSTAGRAAGGAAPTAIAPDVAESWGGGAVEAPARGVPDPPGGAATARPAPGLPLPACRPEPGPMFLRRLTNAEYQSSVRDLLGEAQDVSAGFAEDARVRGFDNNAETVTISPTHATQYQLAAERVATSAFASTARRTQIVGCDLAAASSRAVCLKGFVEAFGRRAYRRPLAGAEVEALLELANAAAADPDPFMSARLVVEALLQAPGFLFRAEVGVPDASRPDLVRLTGYEIAARLSFLLWKTTPDATLLDAAGKGELDSAAGVEARFRAMLQDPRARVGLRSFYRQWLHTSALDDVSRDPAQHPIWSDGMVASLREEVDRLVEPLVTTRDAGVLQLFTTRQTWIDGNLARLYGLPPPKQWQRVELDGAKRGGLMTLGATLIPTANGNHLAMPIYRGVYVREVLLCDPPPPPPVNIPDLPGDVRPGATERQHLEAHSKSPACAPCHLLMDPIGLGLANYDAVAAWRSTDVTGRPIDARGVVQGLDRGDFTGGVELGQKLGASPQAAKCVVASLFRYSQGRDTVAADACTLDGLLAFLKNSGDRFLDMAVAFVRSDAFRYRQPVSAQAGAKP